MLEFFTTDAPDPHHCTLNSCFCAFLSARVHLGPFCYCMKLAAKLTKLVQLIKKFVQWCLVRFFRNERSRSRPLDPKLMFWCVSFCSSAFWTVSLLHEIGAKLAKLVQLMQKFMPRYRARIFHNERSQSTPLDPKLRVWWVSFHLGGFGTISLLHKTCCKTRQTGAINAKLCAAMSC